MGGVLPLASIAYLVVSGLVLSCCADVVGPYVDSFPIDWTLVPLSPTNSLVTQTDAYGACECNLTYEQCDANCCCDPDCTTPERALFQYCMPTGPSNATLETCVSQQSMYTTNLPESAGLTAQTSANNVLCIKYDNSPSKGYFFSEPSFLSTSSTDALFPTPAPSTTATFEEESMTTASTIPSLYSVGTPVVAYRTSGKLAYTNGYLSTPQPGPTGLCEGNFYAAYMQQTLGAACPQPLSNTSMSCSSADPILDQSYYVGSSSVYIGTTPQATASSPSSQLVTPTAGQWYYVPDGSVSGSSAFVSVNSTSNPYICNNVITGVVYVVTHDGAGTILSVIANLYANTLDVREGFVTQTVSVFWVLTGTATGQSRSMSGDPGYLAGQPVLGGTLSSQSGKNAILQGVRGMRITGPARDGTCFLESKTVRFLHDTAVSCTSSYSNQAALQSACQAGTIPTPLSGLTSWYIGKYGVANANNISDWISLGSLTTPSIAPTWDSTYLRCAGLVTGVRVRFVYTFAGRLDNPQMLITGASMSYVQEVVQWPGEVSSSSSLSVTLRSSVSFLQQSTDISLITPPAPPVLPRLPSDVLYPFSSDASPSSAFGLAGNACLLSLLAATGLPSLLLFFSVLL